MATVTKTELNQQTAKVLARVAAGEHTLMRVKDTVDGLLAHDDEFGAVAARRGIPAIRL